VGYHTEPLKNKLILFMALTTFFKRSGSLIFVPFVFLAFVPTLLSAQSIYEQVGRLPITIYTPDEYGGLPYVESVIQSEEGLIYIGDNYGIYEYDGVSWRSLFKRNDPQPIRSFTKDATGRIFYAGYGFGYLEVDPKGATQPVSLKHLIPEELGSDLAFTRIHYFNGFIILQTYNHHIIRLELAEDFTLKSLKSWQAETRFAGSFVVGDDFYIQQAEKGIYKLEDDELNFIPDTEAFGKEFLNVMLPYLGDDGHSILLGRRDSGFFLLKEGVLTKFPTQIDQLIEGVGLLRGGIIH